MPSRISKITSATLMGLGLLGPMGVLWSPEDCFAAPDNQTTSSSVRAKDMSLENQNSSKTNLPAQPQTQAKSDYSLKWQFEMDGIEAKDDLNSHKSEFLTGFRMSFDKQLNSWIAVNITPELVAQTGYLQAPDVENPQSSRIDIINASLDIMPIQYTKASVGSLSERNEELHGPLMFKDLSFPAGRLVLQTNPKSSFKLFAYGESAIPTSSSINNNSNDLNTVPSLNTAGVGLDLGKKNDSFSAHARVGYYQFADLPYSIMTASALLGNTGTQTSGSDYTLTHKYSGLEALVSGRLNIYKFYGDIFAEGLKNNEAPSGYNQGWMAVGGVGYNFTKNFAVEPFYEFFYIEPDATVAAYNDSWINTNQNGSLVGLEFVVSKVYHLQVAYEDRLPVYVNPSQPAEQIGILRIRSDDMSF